MAWIARPSTTFGAGYSDGHGGNRATTLRLPPGYRTDISYPLLVCLDYYSGPGGDGALSRQDYSHATQFKDGMLVIAPVGIVDSFGNNAWYLKPEHPTEAAADTDFLINGLIAPIKAAFNVSFTIVSGYSNGAMKWREIMHSNPTAFDAIITHAGVPSTTESEAVNSRVIASLHTHGTLDATVPYNGGDGSQLSGSIAGHATVSAARCAELAYLWNGNAKGPSPTFQASYDLTTTSAGAETDWYQYDAKNVLLIRNGDGHTLSIQANYGGPLVIRWAIDNHS